MEHPQNFHTRILGEITLFFCSRMYTQVKFGEIIMIIAF